MRPRAFPAALAAFLLSCSAPSEPAPKIESADTPSKIRRIVAQIDANLFGEADEAVSRLASFGRAGVPVLQDELKTASDRARGILTRALESVYATDPYYLVRAPDRRVTARLRSVSRKDAFEGLFRGFPMRPMYVEQMDFSRPVPSSTLWFDDATYWQSVKRFADAFRADLAGEIVEEAGSGWWSEPQGPLIVRVRRTGVLLRPTLTVDIHAQPGTQPIDGFLRSLRLVDGQGKEIKATFQTEPEGASFMRLTGNRLKTRVGRVEISHEGRSTGPLVLMGTARVLLPTEIESVSWTSESPGGEQVLGTCRIELKSFDPYSIRHVGPPPPSTEKASSFAERAWIFMSDDKGRSANDGGLSLHHGGEMGAGNWPHDEPYTRLTIVRPVKAEVAEFAFEVKGIRSN